MTIILLKHNLSVYIEVLLKMFFHAASNILDRNDVYDVKRIGHISLN